MPPWDRYANQGQQPAPQAPQQPQANAPRYPGVIQGRPRQPSPTEQRSEEREDARLGITVRGEQRAVEDTDFARANTLRDEFRTNAITTNYATSIEQFAAAINAPNDAAGDQALITAYAKMLDPGSVVREGEFATTAQADNTFGQTLSRIQRELGVEGGGRLSDVARERVIASMRNLVVQRVQLYDQLRDDYTERARRVGIDPFEVVGTHAALPYRETLEESDRRRGITSSRNTVPESTANQSAPPPAGPRPTLGDMFPQGADIALNAPEQPFDEMAYLQREYGIDAGQERQLVGMLNAASRSSNRDSFSADNVRQIYNQLGIPLPDEAGIQQLVEGVRNGNTYGGFDTSAAQAEYERMLDARLQQTGDNPEGIMPTIGASVAQGLSLNQSDELAGFGNALMNPTDPFTAYRVGRDTDRRFNERARAANPGTYLTGEIAGALGTGGVRVGPVVASGAPAAARIAGAAREGAVLGGIAGFGSGEGMAGSLGNAALGATAGAATAGTVAMVAPGANRVFQAIRNRNTPAGTPTRQAVEEIMQAGERMGVPVRRADVDPNVRGQRAEVLQGPQAPVVRSMEADDLASMEQALIREVAGGATDRFAAGDAAQRSLQASITATRNRASSLYQQADSALGRVAVEPTDALAAVDRNIAELSEAAAGNSAWINYLQNTVRADLTRDGGLTVRSLLAQRRGIGAKLRSMNLSDPDFERRLGQIYEAAAQDLERAASGNPQALAQLQEANRLWASQANVRRNIGDALLGRGRDNPLPPKQAAERILGFARNDPARLNNLLGQVDDATRGEIRALVAGELGRQGNNNFSLAQFITATSGGKGAKIDQRSMRLLFGDDGIRAINDLRTLAGAKVAAAERTNYSNTGGIVRGATTGFRRMMLSALGISEAGVTGGAAAFATDKVLSALGEGRAVRLLTNPDFTRWLRSLPDTSKPNAIDASFARLRRAAAGNAGFAADVNALERALVGAVNDNTASAVNVAAEPDRDQQR